MKATVFVHLDDDDEVTAHLIRHGVLVIYFGSNANVFIGPNHDHYAGLRKFFGLPAQENTAPSDETEDGVPAGNEPERVSV